MLAIILVSDFYFFTPISHNISAKRSKECAYKRLKTGFHQVYWPFPSVSAAWCSVSPGPHSGSPAVGIPLAWLAPALATRSVKNNHHHQAFIHSLSLGQHLFTNLSLCQFFFFFFKYFCGLQFGVFLPSQCHNLACTKHKNFSEFQSSSM